MAGIGNKVFLVGFMAILYKKGFFQNSWMFMMKEIGTVGFLIGEIYSVDYTISEYFWRNTKEVIRRNALNKEKDFYDLRDKGV